MTSKPTHNIGEVPYGFNVDASGHLHHNADEQEALSIIRELRSRGWTLRAICDELEDRQQLTGGDSIEWQTNQIATALAGTDTGRASS